MGCNDLLKKENIKEPFGLFTEQSSSSSSSSLFSIKLKHKCFYNEL